MGDELHRAGAADTNLVTLRDRLVCLVVGHRVSGTIELLGVTVHVCDRCGKALQSRGT